MREPPIWHMHMKGSHNDPAASRAQADQHSDEVVQGRRLDVVRPEGVRHGVQLRLELLVAQRGGGGDQADDGLVRDERRRLALALDGEAGAGEQRVREVELDHFLAVVLRHDAELFDLDVLVAARSTRGHEANGGGEREA